MLVLSRKQDGVIVIGDPLNPIARIMVVEIRGDKVRLGIEAGKNVPVHREEIAEDLKRKKKKEDNKE